MSEELAAGAVSLEEPAAIVGPTEPVTGDDAPPDGTIEGSGGVKFAPLPALIAERTQRKEAQKAAADKDAKIAELQDKASKFDELAGYVAQAKPIIEAVRNRPDLVEQARQPKPEPKAAQVLSADEAVEYAKDLDLYKPDGTPDVDRAQRLATRQQAISDRTAKENMAPLHARDAQQGANAMRASILSVKDAQGRTVDAKALDTLFNIMPPELAAKPEVAQFLYYAAKGMTEHTGKAPVTGPGPVLHTDTVTNANKPSTDLSAAGKRMAEAAGLTQSEFKKSIDGYKPGALNVLE